VPGAGFGLGASGVAVLFALGTGLFGAAAIAGLGAGDAGVSFGAPRPAKTKYEIPATTTTAPAISAMRAVGDSGPVSLGIRKISIQKNRKLRLF
jgi:hypothetical protein